MNDVWFAMLLMAVVAIVAGVITARFLPRESGQLQRLIIALSTFGMFAFLFYAAGRLYWAIVIRDSAVIVWSNLTPILAAIAAGCCWRLTNTPLWRQVMLTGALITASVAAILWPLIGITLRPPPAGGDVWQQGVALQTAWATCSPAAAATFLRAGGIDVDEADLVSRCLTDASGTPTLGLYRGVKVVAAEQGRDVAAVRLSLDQLLRDDDWPVLMMVELPIGEENDPRYASEWGWIPGLGHSVVALGRTADGRILVGDPAAGLEAWTEEDLRVLWHGDAIRFVLRGEG